ncbi:probable polygalacturonase At3g15720 [Vicia villosa]|uniref:probable polygalacturonase At3g15720 n=1 Tax=Vicia villosa TaxID=3911 RepID=UPI00273B00E0|nr:probable polygalacturonase At3g15720 [Vicia villosa]
MDMLITALLIISIVFCNSWVGFGKNTFDVLKYGAKGDGTSDDTDAFVKAFKDFCEAKEGTPTLEVPAGHTFLVHQNIFKGPCNSQNLHIKLDGTILAPHRNAWGACSKRWLQFVDVHGITFDGSGVIDGNGEDWWKDYNSTTQCNGSPTALIFDRCDGLQLSGINHLNGPGFHLNIVHSKDVTISHININATASSHNTDGIDLTNAIRVNIQDSTIQGGDDCIAIKGGSQFINVTRVTCGPTTHGISVGSLGGEESEEFAENINIENCTFNGAVSAVKIKTCPGGKGYVKSVVFDHITVNEVDNPIYLDQHYMHTPEKPDALKVSNITISNISGTYTGEEPIVLDCAKIWCDNITLQHIKLTAVDPTKPSKTICNNVNGITDDDVSPSLNCVKT